MADSYRKDADIFVRKNLVKKRFFSLPAKTKNNFTVLTLCKSFIFIVDRVGSGRKDACFFWLPRCRNDFKNQ
jgi:hypothetical protein